MLQAAEVPPVLCLLRHRLLASAAAATAIALLSHGRLRTNPLDPCFTAAAGKGTRNVQDAGMTVHDHVAGSVVHIFITLARRIVCIILDHRIGYPHMADQSQDQYH